jgi:Uri superfamily endonuclease
VTAGEPGNAPEKGVYALIVAVQQRLSGLRVGRLGRCDFAPGHYVYVGSALRGLRPRVERHLHGAGNTRHWHIDYLVDRARPEVVLAWGTDRDLECELSRRVRALADGSVEEFGCSDCRCRSHLYYFRSDPLPRLAEVRLPCADGGELAPCRIARDEAG